MYLLASPDGKSFTSQRVDAWEIQSCPMSSAALASRGEQVFGAWETDGNIGRTTFDKEQRNELEVRRIPSVANKNLKRKHPSIAVGKDGQSLLAWSEGTGWERGGSVHWQVFNASGAPIGSEGSQDGLPAWSKPSAVSDSSGGFLIFY